jgi:hypothetical protein
MAKKRSGRTPEQVRAAIDALDLTQVLAKATETYQWTPEQAGQADHWYRNFLWLCYKHGPPLGAIGKDADDLWHVHLLDTAKYRADCQTVFGHFLDHTPLYGPPGARETETHTATTALYQSEFGALPAKIAYVSIYS